MHPLDTALRLRSLDPVRIASSPILPHPWETCVGLRSCTGSIVPDDVDAAWTQLVPQIHFGPVVPSATEDAVYYGTWTGWDPKIFPSPLAWLLTLGSSKR